MFCPRELHRIATNTDIASLQLCTEQLQSNVFADVPQPLFTL